MRNRGWVSSLRTYSEKGWPWVDLIFNVKKKLKKKHLWWFKRMKIPLLEGKTVNSIQFFFLFKFEPERWNNIQRTAEMIRLVLFFFLCMQAITSDDGILFKHMISNILQSWICLVIRMYMEAPCLWKRFG